MNKTVPTLVSKNYLLRGTYLFLAIITTVIGLATRKAAHLFHPFIAEYGGDTLWALLFFLLARMVWINKPIWFIAVITYIFCVLIECTQLYQGEWIVRWRQTFAGQMILGQGFLWSDFICYATGVIMGCVIAYTIEKRSRKQENSLP